MDNPTRVLIILLILYALLTAGGCTQIDINVYKSQYVLNSSNNDISYENDSKTDSVAELNQDVSDLIDATIPLK